MEATRTRGLLAALMCVGCAESAPALEVALLPSPLAVDLGVVQLGASGRSTLRLTLQGTSRVELRSVRVLGALAEDVRVDAAPAAVLATLPARIELVFTPQSLGTRVGRLEIVPSEGPPLEVPLSGSADEGLVAVSPQTIDFGEVLVGLVAEAPVVLTNRGPSPVRFDAVTRAPGTSAAFTTDLEGRIELSPGQSASVNLRFAPSDEDVLTGRLVFVDPEQRGAAPAVSVAGQGTLQPLEVSPTEVSFQGSFVGQARTRTIRVANDNFTPVVIDPPSLTVSGEPAFSVAPEAGWPRTLDPGDELFLEVAFAPTVPGENTATLTLTTAGHSATVEVFADAQPSSSARLDVEPMRIDLGAIPLGGRVEVPLVIRNPVAVGVEVLTWRLGDVDATLVRPWSAGRLPAASWHAVDVEVHASRLGVRTATVVVQVGGTEGSRVLVPVTWEARPEAQLPLTVWTPADFGAVPRGVQAELRVPVESFSEVPRRIDALRWLDDAGGRLSVVDADFAPRWVAPGERVRVPLRFYDGDGLPAAYRGRLAVVVEGVEQVVDVTAETAPALANPDGLFFVLTHTGSATVDLHVLTEGGGLFDAPLDVSSCAPGPRWGALEDRLDDPRWSGSPRMQSVHIPAPTETSFEVWAVHVDGPEVVVDLRMHDERGGLGGRSGTLGPGTAWRVGRLDVRLETFTDGPPPQPWTARRCY